MASGLSEMDEVRLKTRDRLMAAVRTLRAKCGAEEEAPWVRAELGKALDAISDDSTIVTLVASVVGMYSKQNPDTSSPITQEITKAI